MNQWISSCAPKYRSGVNSKEKKNTHNKRQRMRRRQENDKHKTSCRYAHFLKQNNNRKKTSKINTKGRRMLGTQRVNIKMKNIWIYSFICSYRARTYYISRYFYCHTHSMRAHTHTQNKHNRKWLIIVCLFFSLFALSLFFPLEHSLSPSCFILSSSSKSFTARKSFLH